MLHPTKSNANVTPAQASLRQPWSCPKQAFTLIEVLVVILILGVLMGLLIPGISAVRSAAKSTKCMSNLRQIAMCSLVWTEEHEDWCLPGNYRAELAPLGVPEATFHCPSYTGPMAFETFGTGISQSIAGPGEGPGTDGDGVGLWGVSDVYFWVHGNTKSSAISNTSETVYFCDSDYYVAGYWWSILPARRHRGKANIVWVDGHVSVEPANYATVAPTGKYFYY